MVLLAEMGQIDDIPHSAFCALLRHPVTGWQPAEITLRGTSAEQPDALNYLVGYLTVLRNVGLISRSQIKIKDGEIIRSNVSRDKLFYHNGYWVSMNRYYLATDEIEDVIGTKKRNLALIERCMGNLMAGSTADEWLGDLPPPYRVI
jgi:hypothetical protein